MTDDEISQDKEPMEKRITRLEVKDEVREKDIEEMKKGMNNLSSNVSKIAAKQDAQGEQLNGISKGMARLCEHFGAKKVVFRWVSAVVVLTTLIAGILGMNYQFPWVTNAMHAIGMKG